MSASDDPMQPRRHRRILSTIALRVGIFAVVMLADTGFVRDVAAAPVSPPPGFEWDCLALGGEYIEIYDSSGNITEYSCKWHDGSTTTCTSQGCSTTRVQPSGRVVDPSDVGSVIEAAPTETSSPFADPLEGVETLPVLTEDPTAAPTAPPGVPVLSEDPPTPTAAPTETAMTDAPTGATPGAPSEPQSGQPSGSTAGQPAVAGPASLTLVTYTCASGYDLFAPAADPAGDCPDPTDGVRFGLEGNGTETTRSSGDDGAGIATFTDLDPGAYQLVGQPPMGLSVAFVLDCTSNVRSFADAPFFPLAIVGPYGTLAVTLQPGEELTCAWYGIPAA